MRTLRLAGLALATLPLCASSALAVDWIVRADGGGDFTTIKAAVETTTNTSLASGDRILITEAGTYSTTSVTIPTGFNLTFEASVAGVIAEQSSGSWGLTGGPSANITLTFKNFTIRRTDGTGAAIDVTQSTTNTLDLVFEDMVVHHSDTDSGGEAIRIVVAASAGALVTVDATNTTFQADRTINGSAKAAFRVQGTTSGNFTVNLTDCTISNINSTGSTLPAIQTDASSDQNWTITGCTISSATDRGFRALTAHNDSTFTFRDTTITAVLEGIVALSTAAIVSNATWDIQRCTIDNSGSTGVQRAIRMNFAASSSGNTCTVHNCVIKTNAASGRGIDVANVATANFHHNTIVGVGDATSGTSVGIAAGATGANFSNSLFLNFADPVSGTTGTKSGNVVCGPNDDTSAGGDRQFFSVTSTSSSPGDMLSTLDIDASFKPLSNSSALAGTGDDTIDDLVGNVDRDNNTRPNPSLTDPDVGAYETAFVPVELDSFRID